MSDATPKLLGDPELPCRVIRPHVKGATCPEAAVKALTPSGGAIPKLLGDPELPCRVTRPHAEGATCPKAATCPEGAVEALKPSGDAISKLLGDPELPCRVTRPHAEDATCPEAAVEALTPSDAPRTSLNRRLRGPSKDVCEAARTLNQSPAEYLLLDC